jgi:predicted kinase
MNGNILKMEIKPKIYVAIGAPCSGKSTWINKFIASQKEEYVVISSDNIIEQLSASDGLNYSQGWQKYIGRATAMMKANFRHAVNSNSNIIYDQTNMGAKKRKSIIANLDNYEKIAVVFDCDTKTLFDRNKKRAETSGKFIPEDVILNMLKRFDPISKDENFDRIIRVP